MDDIQYENFDFEIDPEESIFIISVVSEMVDIPVWTLRKFDEMGIVMPKRLGKKTRCYSKNQIKKLHILIFRFYRTLCIATQEVPSNR